MGWPRNISHRGWRLGGGAQYMGDPFWRPERDPSRWMSARGGVLEGSSSKAFLSELVSDKRRPPLSPLPAGRGGYLAFLCGRPPSTARLRLLSHIYHKSSSSRAFLSKPVITYRTSLTPANTSNKHYRYGRSSLLTNFHRRATHKDGRSIGHPATEKTLFSASNCLAFSLLSLLHQALLLLPFRWKIFPE